VVTIFYASSKAYDKSHQTNPLLAGLDPTDHWSQSLPDQDERHDSDVLAESQLNVSPDLCGARLPTRTVEPDGEHLSSARLSMLTYLLPEIRIPIGHLSRLQLEMRVPLSPLEAVYR
jgi:hypothetical protein